MNDGRRLDLERFFDGELPPGRHAEIARLLPGDGEARLYLARLARLRDLARAHEAAAGRPAGQVLLTPRSGSLRSRALAAATTAALAASVAVVILWRARTIPEVPDAPRSTTIAAPGPIAAPAGRIAPTREVELYTWANRNWRRPETAAVAILLSSAHSRRRPSAVEVLALDLANAGPGLADELEPLALLHRAPPGGRGRMERHPRRPRPTAPRT